MGRVLRDCKEVDCLPHRCSGGVSLRRAGVRIKGAILFRKREWPLWNPKRKASIGSLELEHPLCLWNGNTCARRGRVEVAIRFDLLLLSAAALPVSWQCSLISVYRQSLQCGERQQCRIPQAVCRQTNVTRASRSKARLQHVTTRRRFMAKPCTPHLHCAARAVIQATDCQCRGSRGSPLAFSWGI